MSKKIQFSVEYIEDRESKRQGAIKKEKTEQNRICKILKALDVNDHNYTYISEMYISMLRESINRQFELEISRFSDMNIKTYHI